MLPTLVLLPGLDGTGELFAPFLAELDSEIPTLVVRYPSGEFLDYPALTGLVKSQLPDDRPFVLLAESFSGPIAISVAADQPTHLAGLILCASFARNPRPLLMGSLWFSRVPSLIHVLNWLAALAMLNGFRTKDLVRRLALAVAQVDPRVMAARFQAVLKVDVTSQLERIQVASLYLRGSKDLLVPESSAKLIVAKRKNWRLIELPAPHLMLQAMPREVAQIVRSCIAESNGGGFSVD